MPLDCEIKFNNDGTVETPWWTPEIADLICKICGSNGWEKFGRVSPSEFMTLPEEGKKKWGRCFLCTNRQPFCG